MTNDDTTKRACLYMLERGLANHSELARLSGRSKQIIAHWAKDYPNARAERLAKYWQKALLSGVKK
jgi:endonuclease I